MNILTFIVTSLLAIANASPEQVAFNYFATEIINKSYPDSKAIYFSGQTEGEKSISGPFVQCFKSDTDFGEFYYQWRKSEDEKLNIESSNFSILQKSSKPKLRQLNLKIYRAVANDETVYVYIKVFKEKHFVDHYLLKISSNIVVDVCHKNEVI